MNRVPRAKIVCTIGPATQSKEMLQNLINAGMNVARLNLSHGTPEDHKQIIQRLRELSAEIAIMIDLPGPKIRLGSFEGTIYLVPHDLVILNTSISSAKRVNAETFREQYSHLVSFLPQDLSESSSSSSFSSTIYELPLAYSRLPLEVKIGGKLYINDGIVELTILHTTSTEILCTVTKGGSVSSRKGINAPGANLSLRAPTQRDIELLTAMADTDIDFVSISFVRFDEDIYRIRELTEQFGMDVHLIAKIEHGDALTNIDSILRAADALMIARGDLAVETPSEDVPFIQKFLIKKARALGKPVIVATQMLESMVFNSVPTRAETSDVTNAVLDGADAVMLSAETSTGKHPIEAVTIMKKILLNASRHMIHETIYYFKDEDSSNDISENLAYSSAILSHNLNVDAILCLTRSGATAQMVAKYRPPRPIVACSSSIRVRRKLQLIWGVEPILFKEATSFENRALSAVQTALRTGNLQVDSMFVLVAGPIRGPPGNTRTIAVHEVHELISETEEN